MADFVVSDNMIDIVGVKIMKSIFRLSAMAVMVAIVGGVYCVPAWAVDEKTIPATGCTVLSGLGTAFRDTNGRLFNTSSIAEINVFCPLVRDNVVSAPTSVKAVVVDNSSLLIGIGNISCQLRSMTANGNLFSSGPIRSTTGTNSAGTILTLTPVSESDRGAYAVYCTIPRRGVGDPSSYIASITIDEP